MDLIERTQSRRGRHVTRRDNYRLHSQFVFLVPAWHRGRSRIAAGKNLERPSGGLRDYLPTAFTPGLHKRNLAKQT